MLVVVGRRQQHTSSERQSPRTKRVRTKEPRTSLGTLGEGSPGRRVPESAREWQCPRGSCDPTTIRPSDQPPTPRKGSFAKTYTQREIVCATLGCTTEPRQARATNSVVLLLWLGPLSRSLHSCRNARAERRASPSPIQPTTTTRWSVLALSWRGVFIRN